MAPSSEMEPLERTDEIISMALFSLPNPPDAMIRLRGGGEVQRGGAAAEGAKKKGGKARVVAVVGGDTAGSLCCGARHEGGEGGSAGSGGGGAVAGGKNAAGGGSGLADSGSAGGALAGGKNAVGGGSGFADSGSAGGAVEGGNTAAGGDDGLADLGGDGGRAGSGTVGWNGFDHYLTYDPYMDLYIYARPLSSFWKSFWEEMPLVLHDKHLAMASEFVARRGVMKLKTDLAAGETKQGSDSTGVTEQIIDLAKEVTLHRIDLTKEISDVLDAHPGPVETFRIDTTVWANAEGTLVNWVKKLSDKGIRDLIIINLAHGTDLLFPLDELQSPKLRCLRLGFMTLPELDLNCFDYSSLHSLQLICCSFDGRRLPWIINACVSLYDLNISFSMQNLKIDSKSLVAIQIWQCSASWFTITSAPKLWHLTIGIRPRKGNKSVLVAINDTPLLTELNFLQLPFHEITVNSCTITKDTITMAFLLKLRLGIDLAVCEQKARLLNVLKCLPLLQNLTVWVLLC